MFSRPVSTLFCLLAITVSVSCMSSPIQAELVFLGYSAATNDNPQQGQDDPIIDVINSYYENLNLDSGDLILIDKDEEDGNSDNGFEVTGIDSGDGTYSYTGPGFADILTLKSGNNMVEVYWMRDMQSGDWDNQYKNALSHASAWRIVPEPTSFALFGFTMLGLARRRR